MGFGGTSPVLEVPPMWVGFFGGGGGGIFFEITAPVPRSRGFLGLGGGGGGIFRVEVTVCCRNKNPGYSFLRSMYIIHVNFEQAVTTTECHPDKMTAY